MWCSALALKSESRFTQASRQTLSLALHLCCCSVSAQTLVMPTQVALLMVMPTRVALIMC